MKIIQQGEMVRVILHKYYYFDIPIHELQRVGVESINDNKFVGNINEKRLSFLLNRYKLTAKNLLNKREVTIIDFDNPLPLVGSLSFGFIDRGTNIIDVRPMTGCNLNCIYCSVGEGLHSNLHDFFVDKDYLLYWAERVVREKKELDPDIKIYFLLNPQGEPLLYPYIKELIKGLKEINDVYKVGIVTNGALLTRELLIDLYSNGLDSLHVSLNGLNDSISKLYGVNYPLQRVIDVLRNIPNGLELFLTPVWIKGMNDQGIEEVVSFGKELINQGKKVKFGIQNYLFYKHGKRIPNYREVSWNEFFAFLKGLEEKYGVKLLLSKEEAEIINSKHLKKPFHKGELVNAIIVSKGRYRNEYLGASSDRVITIKTKKNLSINQKVKVKIFRDKDNLFVGHI